MTPMEVWRTIKRDGQVTIPLNDTNLQTPAYLAKIRKAITNSKYLDVKWNAQMKREGASKRLFFHICAKSKTLTVVLINHRDSVKEF